MRTVLPPQVVPDKIVRAIVAKGQGNPFFLGESPDWGGVLEGSIPGSWIPETVQAVLAARLYRLPPEAKALVQVAAVIGTEVPGLCSRSSRRALRRRSPAPRYLQGAELLYTARPVPEPVTPFSTRSPRR